MLNFRVVVSAIIALIFFAATVNSNAAELGTEIEILSAHGESSPFFPASNVLDDDLALVSMFASNANPEDLFLDLGKVWNIENLNIAWGRGHNRSHEFEIATRATESEAWSIVFHGQSAGNTLDFETYDVEDSEAQFIRIRGLSNSRGSSWTFITEVDVFGSPAKPPEIEIKSASGQNHALYPASNVLDGNLDRLSIFASNENPDDLILDLGKVWDLKVLNIAWGRGNNRSFEFEIATRVNKTENWSKMFYGHSTGETEEFESYDIPATEARFVRIRGLSNSRGNAWTLINEVKAFGHPTNQPEPEEITELKHFGEPVTLVGANIPWSSDSGFSTDFGWYSPLDIAAYRNLFSRLQLAGGNSARVWVHTTAQVTPYINEEGSVLSLSHISPNEVVIDQLESVLDEAWERGIVVTFSLFSFDMFCDAYGDDFGYNSYRDIERHQIMIEKNFQSYIDNALTPIVEGLKDHPGLFAYEVFNEPEGAIIDMTGERHFCPDEANVPGDGLSFPLSLEGAQRFVNHVAAAVHEADPNVKVTTSTHTNFFTSFSNETLTSQPEAKPNGTLDFYELHHYQSYDNPPYITGADVYEADRPIIIGEYELNEVQQESLFQVEGPDSMSAIIEHGYAGGWPWSILTDDLGKIDTAIANVPTDSAIDKAAVEACIEAQDASCYNQIDD